MNLVEIEGLEATVRELRDIPDVILVPSSTKFLDEGRIRMGAYATDRAVPEIENRGATVTTVIDNAALAARFADLDARIGQSEPPPVA